MSWFLPRASKDLLVSRKNKVSGRMGTEALGKTGSAQAFLLLSQWNPRDLSREILRAKHIWKRCHQYRGGGRLNCKGEVHSN
jgi:hypothetical protein